MGCRLVSAKSLSELMLNYYVLDPLEQTSKFYLKHFHSRKCIWKYCLKMSTILSQSQCVKVSIIEVRAWMRHGWLIISWQKTGDRVTYSCLDLVSCRGLRLHWGYIIKQGIVAWSELWVKHWMIVIDASLDNFSGRDVLCQTSRDIKNNAWVVVNNVFLVTSEVTSENHWQITSGVTKKKIAIHGNECIILFLTCYFMSWTHRLATNNHRSLISPLSLRTAFSDLTLWRHHNWAVTSRKRKHWHCDVIFVDCSCTRKLAQRWSSLLNNNHEYRFFTTQYSRLSV